MSFVVGLTGGIGSGKSTVAELFAECGAEIIDTDAISHQLTASGGRAIAAIRQLFGDAVIDASGAMDRAAVRRIAFADPAARTNLEAVLHPMIREAVSHRLSRVIAPYAILVVPLLVETGAYRDRLDRVLVVDCDEATQLQRVMARSQLSEAEVQAIIGTQARREDRLRHAHDVLENHGDRDSLRSRVAALHQQYLQAAREKAVRSSAP